MNKMLPVFSVILLLSLNVSTAFAIDASDWAKAEIEKSEKINIIPHSIKSKMRGEINREEFCEIVIALIENYPKELSSKSSAQNSISFADTNSQSVIKAAELGIVNGVESNLFAPKRSITRAEAASMLTRAGKLILPNYSVSEEEAGRYRKFLESAEGKMLEKWKIDGMRMPIELGVMKGNGLSFETQKKISSEQALIMAYRLKEAIDEKKEYAAAHFANSKYSSEELARIAKIKRLMQGEYKLENVSKLYEVEPSVANMEIGKLSQETFDNALKVINFARLLANVGEVTFSEDYNKEAQYAAFVLSATNQFTHFPKNDGTLPLDVFKKGADAAATSNLGWGYEDPFSFNISCLRDNSIDNRDLVGHRRWLLDPRASKMGLGMYKEKVATRVIDISKAWPDSKVVTWPSEGVFPILPEYEIDKIPWSISLKKGYLKSAEVKMVCNETGEKWLFSGKNPSGDERGNRAISSGGRFSFGGGESGYLIFTPKNLKIEDGRSYTISYKAVGKNTYEGTYTVKLFK